MGAVYGEGTGQRPPEVVERRGHGWSYRFAVLGDIVALRWTGAARPEGVHAALSDVREVYLRVGRPVLFIALPGAGAEPPDAATRQTMHAASAELATMTESIHVHVHAHTLVQKLIRSAVRAMMVLRREKDRVYLHTSLRRLAEAAARDPVRGQHLLESLLACGLVTEADLEA
jgi:hypothetical protein